MQDKTRHDYTIYDNPMQYTTRHVNARYYIIIHDNTIQHIDNTIQYKTIQHNIIQHKTRQCNTIQYNTRQDNTL